MYVYWKHSLYTSNVQIFVMKIQSQVSLWKRQEFNIFKLRMFGQCMLDGAVWYTLKFHTTAFEVWVQY